MQYVLSASMQARTTQPTQPTPRSTQTTRACHCAICSAHDEPLGKVGGNCRVSPRCDCAEACVRASAWLSVSSRGAIELVKRRKRSKSSTSARLCSDDKCKTTGTVAAASAERTVACKQRNGCAKVAGDATRTHALTEKTRAARAAGAHGYAVMTTHHMQDDTIGEDEQSRASSASGVQRWQSMQRALTHQRKTIPSGTSARHHSSKAREYVVMEASDPWSPALLPHCRHHWAPLARPETLASSAS